MAEISSSSASDIEKSAAHETHHEGDYPENEKHLNHNLRIDGDDEDHMHEPPVSLGIASSHGPS